MAFLSALRIAGSALTAQRLRSDVIANNVANMNTTRTAEGGPYRRQQVIFAARQERLPFRTVLIAHSMANLPGLLGVQRPGDGVQVQNLAPDGRPPKLVFEPDHPDANAEGFVAYPDIDPVTEMADMLSATRAYEANVTTLNAAKAMALKALEIGR
ncbi:MAG: flagellar basal body rod protein FlgC [Chloroflexi bacterium]|nr:flagellar basal body rod protein FlgC [Chloroflexota bacterium]